MAKRRWTLVLVPHGSEPSRIVEVSYGVLRVAASCCRGIPGPGASCRLRHRLPHHRPLARAPGSSRRTPRSPARSTELHGRLSHARRHPHPDLPARRPHPGARQSRADRSAGAGRRHRRSGRITGIGLAGVTGIARRSAEIRIDLERADPPSQPAGLVVQGSGRQPGPAHRAGWPPLRPSCRPRAGSPARSRRCATHPILHVARPHEGIDVTAPDGEPDRGARRRVGRRCGLGNRATGTRSPSTTASASSPSLPTPRSCWSRPGSACPAGQRIALVGQLRAGHRSPPALRGARERPAGGSAQVRAAGGGGDGLEAGAGKRGSGEAATGDKPSGLPSVSEGLCCSSFPASLPPRFPA